MERATVAKGKCGPAEEDAAEKDAEITRLRKMLADANINLMLLKERLRKNEPKEAIGSKSWCNPVSKCHSFCCLFLC